MAKSAQQASGRHHTIFRHLGPRPLDGSQIHVAWASGDRFRPGPATQAGEPVRPRLALRAAGDRRRRSRARPSRRRSDSSAVAVQISPCARTRPGRRDRSPSARSRPHPSMPEAPVTGDARWALTASVTRKTRIDAIASVTGTIRRSPTCSSGQRRVDQHHRAEEQRHDPADREQAVARHLHLENRAGPGRTGSAGCRRS